MKSFEYSSRRVSDQRGRVGAEPDEKRLDVNRNQSTSDVNLGVYYTIRPFKTSYRRVPKSSSRRVSDQRGGVGADPDEERLDVKLHKSTHMVTIDVYYTIRPFKTSSRRVLEIGFGRLSDQRGGVGAEPDEERLDFRAAQRPPLHHPDHTNRAQ